MARCRPQTILAAIEAAGIARRGRGRRRAPLPGIDPETLAEIARLGARARARAVARSLGINREKFDLLIGYRLGNRGQIETQAIALRGERADGVVIRGVSITKPFAIMRLDQKASCMSRLRVWPAILTPAYP